MAIFGRNSEQVFYDGSALPAKYGTGWYVMLDRRPQEYGHTYEAQSDGTWLDITTAGTVTDLADGVISQTKYENVMGVLSELPVDDAIIFMIMHEEIVEFDQHGTTGTLLSNVISESSMTGPEVINYLRPLMADMKESMGKMIGRRIGT